MTKGEKHQFLLLQLEKNPLESREYKQGYQNAIMEVHRQYNLRSRKTIDTAPKKIFDTPSNNTVDNQSKKSHVDIPSSSQDKDVPSSSQSKENTQKENLKK